jgi:hypothetical protein
VRGDVHTNTVGRYYSIFKRGMKGVCQHCGDGHLQRYLAEIRFQILEPNCSRDRRSIQNRKGSWRGGQPTESTPPTRRRMGRHILGYADDVDFHGRQRADRRRRDRRTAGQQSLET